MVDRREMTQKQYAKVLVKSQALMKAHRQDASRVTGRSCDPRVILISHHRPVAHLESRPGAHPVPLTRAENVIPARPDEHQFPEKPVTDQRSDTSAGNRPQQ